MYKNKQTSNIADQCKDKDRNYMKEKFPLNTLEKTEEKQ